MQSSTPVDIVAFSETYGTQEAELSHFIGESEEIVQPSPSPYPPGLYRIVEGRLVRIAPVLPASLR
jgi:hypothetical protein